MNIPGLILNRRLYLLIAVLAVFVAGCASDKNDDEAPSGETPTQTPAQGGSSPTLTPDLAPAATPDDSPFESTVQRAMEQLFSQQASKTTFTEDGQVGAAMPEAWDSTGFELVSVNQLLDGSEHVIPLFAVDLSFASGQGSEEVDVGFPWHTNHIDTFDAEIVKILESIERMELDYEGVRQKAGTDYDVVESFRRNLIIRAEGCEASPPDPFFIPVITWDNPSYGTDVIFDQKISSLDEGILVVTGGIDEPATLQMSLVAVREVEWRQVSDDCSSIVLTGSRTVE